VGHVREILDGTLAPMSAIDVTCTTATDGWLCNVTIGSDWNESRHSVSMTRADFQRLAASGETPDSLVRRSIQFLLDRESKEAILPSFNLTEISRHYPEFEQEIGRQAEAG
jgi:hypothetical protein